MNNFAYFAYFAFLVIRFAFASIVAHFQPTRHNFLTFQMRLPWNPRHILDGEKWPASFTNSLHSKQIPFTNIFYTLHHQTKSWRLLDEKIFH